MGRINKLLILGWIGKKVYDYTLGSQAHEASAPAKRAPAKHAPARRRAHAKRSAPRRKAA
jgi:hypothetical protein